MGLFILGFMKPHKRKVPHFTRNAFSTPFYILDIKKKFINIFTDKEMGNNKNLLILNTHKNGVPHFYLMKYVPKTFKMKI